MFSVKFCFLAFLLIHFVTFFCLFIYLFTIIIRNNDTNSNTTNTDLPSHSKSALRPRSSLDVQVLAANHCRSTICGRILSMKAAPASEGPHRQVPYTVIHVVPLYWGARAYSGTCSQDCSPPSRSLLGLNTGGLQ